MARCWGVREELKVKTGVRVIRRGKLRMRAKLEGSGKGNV